MALLICAFGPACCLFSSIACGSQAISPPELAVDNPVASAGYFRLNWHLPQKPAKRQPEFELQESAAVGFPQGTERMVYHGPDLATVISGRENGRLFYRVRALEEGLPGQWSNIVQVEVHYHSLLRAVTFFGLGAVVFLATLMVVIRGNLKRRSR